MSERADDGDAPRRRRGLDEEGGRPERSPSDGDNRLDGERKESNCGMPPSGDSARLLPAERLPPLELVVGGEREEEVPAVEEEEPPPRLPLRLPHERGRMDSI